jgi:predicted nucleotidyltransferase component of viral defense system
MLLHHNKEDFEQIVQATADDLGLGSFQVEKDYYVSLFLKELQKMDNDIQIVFKGGTSLSKCYDVINRFSEDIDLSVKFNTEKITTSERRKLKTSIIEIIELLGMNFINPEEVGSRRDHNQYNVGYNNVFQPDENTVPYIIVETIVAYKPYPIKDMEVSDYITKYLNKNDRTDLIKKYELFPFVMPIQTLERTFIDKLFAICDYHLENKYNRYSRHIYDVHMIWNSGKLEKDLMQEIVPDVIKDRQLFGKRNVSCQPGAAPNESLKEIVALRVYEADYNDVTTKFIYKAVDYNTSIESLNKIIDLKIIPNQIKEY